MYQSNAIRVLCRITDGTLLGWIERYLKHAIVDMNPIVLSVSFFNGIQLLQVVMIFLSSSSWPHLCLSNKITSLLLNPLLLYLQNNPAIVRRWSNEVQEVVQSRDALVQFHALALLHRVGFLERICLVSCKFVANNSSVKALQCDFTLLCS